MTDTDLLIQNLRRENEALRAELEWKQKEIELARRHEVNWHEVTYRALTSEEKAEYIERGYADYEIPEYIFDCHMPNDGAEILIATSWGVDKDICSVDCDECNNLIGLEGHGDWDGVLAWAEMPKYKGGENKCTTTQ